MRTFIKISKYLGYTLLVITVAGGLFYAYVNIAVGKRIRQTYQVKVQVPKISYDSASIKKGGHLAVIKGCTDCHGPDLGGRVIVDDPGLGIFAGSNLTKGKGGLPNNYSDQDWVRSIRHGINRDHKPLLIMPSQEFTFLTDEDLSALIAYCKTRPAVDRTIEKVKLRPIGYMLTYFDKIPMITAELIDHEKESVAAIPNEISIKNGEYLAVSCSGCHKPNLKGGKAILPGSPDVADITSTGNIGKWTEEQFLTTLRTGQTPEGKSLQNEFMPWQMTKEYSDVELKSLYLYLKSI